MRYFAKKDVTAVSVLDETLLIPLSGTAEAVRNVSRLNDSAAFYWNLLAAHTEDGITEETLLSCADAEFEDENGGKIGIAVLKPELEMLLSVLMKAGHIVAQP